MSVGAATARCSSWAFGGLLAVGSELGCHFRLGIGEEGGGAGAGVGAGKCRRSAEAQRDTASLPLHASLHSSLHSRSSRAGRRFCTIPILTFSGSQIVPFWAQGRGPCLQQNFVFHQLKLPDARLSTRQAVILRSTIALSGSIGSTSPASWRSPASAASKLWMRKARKSKKPWRSGPAAVGGEWAAGEGRAPCWRATSVLVVSYAKRNVWRKKERETNTRGDSTQINKSTCIYAVHRLQSPVSRLPVSLRPLASPS
jgi:hypothetical protein